MTPTMRCCSSMTGATVRLKSVILRVTAWRSQSGWTWAGLGRTTEPRVAVGSRLDQPHHRGRAGDPAVVTPGEDHGQGFGGRGAAAHGLEHVADRGRLRQAEEVGAHEPAGGLGVVVQQRPDLALLGHGEELEHGEAVVLVELDDEIGGVVGRHGGEQAGRLGIGAAADELDLVLGIELLEDIGLELAVLAHRLDDLLALFVRGRFHQVGDLGGMEPGELAVGDAQARRGDVRHEGLDARPVHDLAGRDAPSDAPRQQTT